MEEPIEPIRGCRVRVISGALVLDKLLADLKRAIYDYNWRIKSTNYYLKPVHKVYKTVGGARRIYEYYGRYWWRITREEGSVKFIYVGKIKPQNLPEPPINPLEGLVVIRENRDVILECEAYNRFKDIFKGLKIIVEE
ncbi:MAG: hypothetical protein QXO93_03790 [Acidilobaceae archaeon]